MEILLTVIEIHHENFEIDEAILAYLNKRKEPSVSNGWTDRPYL